MSRQFLRQIDWQRPWLTPFLSVARPLIEAADWRATLNAYSAASGLCNNSGLTIQFVPQANLPPDAAYEAFINATGGVPTRDNLHDFFNALVWLSFPQIKSQLNALQALEIAKAASVSPSRMAQKRGKLRDAATIFDENAALLVVKNVAFIDDLRAHRWHDVFVVRREEFRLGCEVWLFGHALMEKLVSPYKAITAHAWPVIADATFANMPLQEKRAWLDLTVTRQLSNGLTTSDFMPLPVLGVPEWWEGQDDLFYADATVFRPKRCG